MNSVMKIGGSLFFVAQTINHKRSLLQMLFLSFDTDRSGKMSSYELRGALKAAGESSQARLSLSLSLTWWTCGV